MLWDSVQRAGIGTGASALYAHVMPEKGVVCKKKWRRGRFLKTFLFSY